MYQHKLIILGGYGNAGLAIARLLATLGDLRVTLAGRSLQRAVRAAQELKAEFGIDRFSGMAVGAPCRESLYT